MDPFHLLTSGGVKFNKRKFQSDVQVFEKKGQDWSAFEANPNVPVMDFFAASHGEAEKVRPEKVNPSLPPSEGDKPTENSEEVVENENHEKDLDLDLSTKERVVAFRKKTGIRVFGTDVADPIPSFPLLVKQFQLRNFLKRNLASNQYTQPTPIQMQAIPIMLQKRDIISCAPTGSGKTLAFLLPILQDLASPSKDGIRALIISPTRELAAQIHRTVVNLCASKPFKICLLSKSTANVSESSDNSQRRIDILIATPMRLIHAVKQSVFKLDTVKHVVLDEADKLFEQGFLEQIDDIFSYLSHPQIQKSLFSATISSGVESIANMIMKDPIRVVIGAKNAATDTIDQKLMFVGQEEGKLIAIRQLVQQGIKPPVLIFVQSIERAKELFQELVYDGINVDVIHADRTKAQRDAIITSFRLGKTWVLIATELLARGIDFKGVNLVINYDFPQTVASYIHRIGRCGRAGRRGQAITYFTKEDRPYLKQVVNVMRESGCEVPDWMLQLKNPTQTMKKNLKQRPLERDSIKSMTQFDRKTIRHKKQVVSDSRKKHKTSAA